MGIDIIIVNYYSKHKLSNLIESINSSVINNLPIQVIIVNNSPEELLTNLSCNYDLVIIDNKENKGFGFACNQAIKILKYSYTLLLNPDTILLKDTLNKSAEYLNNNEKTTVLGVKHLNEEKKIVPSCSRFPSLKAFFFDSIGLSKIFPKKFTPLFLMTDWEHNNSQIVDQVMGAYLMIRKSFIDSYGLMDERYFVFLEDTDLCKKVWAKGGNVFYNADIALIHEGANSTEGVSDKKICYLIEGKLKYAYKHFPLWKYFFTFVIVVFIEPVFRLFYTALTKKKNIKDVVKGYALFITRHQFK